MLRKFLEIIRFLVLGISYVFLKGTITIFMITTCPLFKTWFFSKHLQCLDITQYLLNNMIQETSEKICQGFPLSKYIVSEVIFSEYWSFLFFGDLRVEFLISSFLSEIRVLHFAEL